VPHPHELVGSKIDDPADVLACIHERHIALPPGVSVYDWDSPTRAVPSPPQVEGGPFTELRLAATPGAAWMGAVLRRLESSHQSIFEVLRDMQEVAIYRIEAPGIRIKDRHTDSRLTGGPVVLRKEGEQAQQEQIHDDDLALVASRSAASSEDVAEEQPLSIGWSALNNYFEEDVVAIAVPDDSSHPTIRADCPVIASAPRIESLLDGPLEFVFLGSKRMRIRDLLSLTDAAGRSATRRFVYFLAREIAHDIFSLSRKSGVKSWLKFGGAVLTFLGSAGSLTWFVSKLAGLFL
jgi:hypothetical protein